MSVPIRLREGRANAVLGSARLGTDRSRHRVRGAPPAPRRLPARRLVLATGPAAALLGALLTHTVLGSGHTAPVLLVALGFAAALVSLLIRPARTRRRRSVTA
ncbi:hypothetical protein SSPO_038630 [Streptomyces antimycoticus]|uniref:Uncharacterized protein n=1 Tax=Streptomyces antimycoticus TaxID=68175 RepID=A0A499UHE3_9ACTN|nr:hypothetical protein SSPO_038630 [Streptomyces antimycoticus]